MDPIKAKANYSRVCQLLVNKGSVALRNVLHLKHPHSTLASVLNTNKPALTKLRYRVIKDPQWNLLFPISGAPDSNNFDITLLTILLRNICRLSPPTTGWDTFPKESDVSVSGDIVRIKLFRNDVYGHVANAQFDDATFHALWQGISKSLIRLGILRKDIDELKDSPLSPEEEIYIEELKKWKELDDDILRELRNLEKKVDNVKEKVDSVEEKVDQVDSKVGDLRNVLENTRTSEVDQLAKFDFTGKIVNLCEKFHDGTREWLFNQISSSFCDTKSKVIILTASPGFGKSVLLAKVCEMYKQRDQLAANHFCDFRNSDYSNPHKILQSLASQMCENVDGFKEKLTEALCREHSRESLSDAFRVLLNDPLHALSRNEEMLIVVDALDESKTDSKNEFLELISEKFSELPKWIKILISSRPEGQVRKFMPDNHPLEIYPTDPKHCLDLKHFIQYNFPDSQRHIVNSLVHSCQGSFLYAYYLVEENVGMGIDPSVPKGISGFYDKQFKRLKTGLQRCEQVTYSSILKNFINVVAASREPLPIKILLTCMGLCDKQYEIREIISEIMSEILPVYDDCLTVYHKSLWDWLTLNGYEEHAFVADVADGNNRLWRTCERVYSNIESLKSVSDVRITPSLIYALKYGANYLLTCVHDAEDLRWLVSVRINYLKLKLCSFDLILNLDFPRILEVYKSLVPDFANHLHRKIVQLNSFSKRIVDLQFKSLLQQNIDVSFLDVYLQFIASECHNVQNTYYTVCKSETEDILNKTKEIWIQTVESKKTSKFKIISHGICRNRHLPFIISRAMEVSPSNNLLAFLSNDQVEVFKLPNLEIVFKVKVGAVNRVSRFVKFSPDSSYFICNSIRFCVSIRGQEKVPFIPHGPEQCLYCSFSTCGKKLFTSEPNCIKMWDVEKKMLLVEVDTKVDVEYCFFSNCGSFILARPRDDELNFEALMNFDDFVVLEADTLKRLNNLDKVCADRCLTHGSCYQMFSPPPLGPSLLNKTVRVSHFHLPSGEVVLIANKHCTKPFEWKERSCVAFSNSIADSSELLVYDYINEEIVELFDVNISPGGTSVSYITKMEKENFLVCANSRELFILSFESRTECSPITFVKLAELKCCAMSPREAYLACCYENCMVTIERIDSREILQSFVLKQQPEACWWSQSYLWIVSRGVGVKFLCDWTKTKVLKDENEECVIEYENVLKFDQGVLVIRLPENGGISILKLVNEKLCRQEIPDSHFDASSVAISSDGCAVLLYRKSSSDYHVWENVHENRWELLSDGKLDYAVNWFCLTRKEGCRSSLWLMFISSSDFEDNLTEPLFLSSIDFPSKKMACSLDIPLPIFVCDKNVVYVNSHFLVIKYEAWLYYIDVSKGAIIAKLHLDYRKRGKNHCYFYISSKGLLLLVSDEGAKYFKVHNVGNLLNDK